MLVGYFDDSGTHKQSSVATMAGYLSTEENWTDFEKEVSSVFEDFGITTFHAVDMYHCKREFKGWSTPQKKSFSTRLFDVAGKFVACGVTYSIDKADHEKVKRHVPNNSAYGECLNITIKNFARTQPFVISDRGLSLHFESGNSTNANVLSIFDTIRKDNPEIAGKLLSADIVNKGSCRAVQLADYLAYFSWRLAEKAAKDRLWGRCVYLDLAVTRVPVAGGLTEDLSPNPDY